MKMTWNNCFSPSRFGVKGGENDVRTEYERDWDRLIFSSPFRRLQNKTQVFPLPEEVFVHNRLTHSLEVASVGRSLGQIIGDRFAELDHIKEDREALLFYQNHLKSVISSACLAHDLGNPAFGHSGEEAISQYFNKRSSDDDRDVAFRAQFSPEEWKDLTTFEGNANALRILTNKKGFYLTYSTIGGILKYPCESSATDKKFLHRKKYGYFKIDEKDFLTIAEKLHLIKDETAEGISYKRHPFVFLVEAADDIAYNIIDFEDAHRLGILSYERVRDAFLAIVEQNPNDDIEWVRNQANKLKHDPNESLAYLRAKAMNTLVHKCADQFWNNRETILQGDFNKSLIKCISELKPTLDDIKKISIEQVYNARSVIQLEIAGFRIMSGLVEDFVSAALTPKQERDKEQRNILSLLPHQFSIDEAATPYVKVMSIIDFIAGMTDLYALKLYRKLRGIEI